jgi:hypothetical protein
VVPQGLLEAARVITLFDNGGLVNAEHERGTLAQLERMLADAPILQALRERQAKGDGASSKPRKQHPMLSLSGMVQHLSMNE